MIINNLSWLTEPEITCGAKSAFKDQVSIALTFREACNKIIHADDIEYFKENSMSEGLSYEVTLYGSQSNKRWAVIFDIFKFLEAAHGTT